MCHGPKPTNHQVREIFRIEMKFLQILLQFPGNRVLKTGMISPPQLGRP
jgi:hypothetical protein